MNLFSEMGISLSRESLNNLLDDSQNDCTPKALPAMTTTFSNHFLPADFDPRSPTPGIDRTPISVAPVLHSDLADPRSPTIGIDRTPIICDKKEDGEI